MDAGYVIEEKPNTRIRLPEGPRPEDLKSKEIKKYLYPYFRYWLFEIRCSTFDIRFSLFDLFSATCYKLPASCFLTFAFDYSLCKPSPPLLFKEKVRMRFLFSLLTVRFSLFDLSQLLATCYQLLAFFTSALRP
jgi:hypothetical protein